MIRVNVQMDSNSIESIRNSLAQFDWTYSNSDDHAVLARGDKVLKGLTEQIRNLSVTDPMEAANLWDAHARYTARPDFLVKKEMGVIFFSSLETRFREFDHDSFFYSTEPYHLKPGCREFLKLKSDLSTFVEQHRDNKFLAIKLWDAFVGESPKPNFLLV